MNTSLEHLPAIKRDQLRLLTTIITKAVDAEKIFLYGIHASDPGGSDLYTDPLLPDFLSSYDLLVVTHRVKHRHDYEIQDKLENRCRFRTQVTVLVHDIEYVNKRLAEGDYFFCKILRDAILLFDVGSIPLVEGKAPNLLSLKETAQRDFDKFWHQSDAFFKSSLYNKVRKEFKVAVFLLHQAAENAYQAILTVFNGYKPCTHNPDKLRRYTNRFSIELAMLFPRNTDEEQHLFKLLIHGYIDARYKEEYVIGENELDLLTERISKLLSIASRICQNRFISIDKLVAAGKEIY
ncbi:MAG: HEPN domain-containing protein [Ignavibacteriaceae bacterium]|nr:HEPN domain-containing protein [Ignavibacteriaceae bacterium]